MNTDFMTSTFIWTRFIHLENWGSTFLWNTGKKTLKKVQ